MAIREKTGGQVSERQSNGLQKIAPILSEIAQIESRELFFKDSSDIQPGDWVAIARCIEENYGQFDGFVVLHGTDTMAYTASALSFCLYNLSKPVILTGSQVPLSVIRSDAARNLINAVQMASLAFNEVAVCFSDKIFRGNRTTKMSIGDFTAFQSPNFPPLAEIGLDINIKHTVSPAVQPLQCEAVFSEDILVMRLFPGMKPSAYIPMLDSGIRAVIISAYGSGNFPITDSYSLIPFLEACNKRNIFMVMASQALHDSVNLETYASGRIARELGVISARDMTMEAAITKMMHLLARYTNPYEIRDLYNRSIAGECAP